jgi:hypothetical protein
VITTEIFKYVALSAKIKMINLGKVLVLEDKHPSELKKVPERIRTDAIYNYVLNQINGTGWRPDYALQALALLQGQDLSSYDLSPFGELQGVNISDAGIDFDLGEVTRLGYEHIKRKRDTRVSLGILRFVQEQGTDINPRKLVAYGLKRLPKNLFMGLNLLAEAKNMGLVDNILTPETDAFIPKLWRDKDEQPRSEEQYKTNRAKYFKVTLDMLAGELGKKGDFETAELVHHMYKGLGLPINEEASDDIMQKVAFSMVEHGDGNGLRYFFPSIGSRSHLLKGRDLSKVVQDGYGKLTEGKVEEGLKILSLAKLGRGDIALSEEQQRQVKDHLVGEVKSLRNNCYEPYKLNFYLEDMQVLGIALNEGDNTVLKDAFLGKLKKLKGRVLLNLYTYLECCNYAGINFDDICEIGYQ